MPKIKACGCCILIDPSLPSTEIFSFVKLAKKWLSYCQKRDVIDKSSIILRRYYITLSFTLGMDLVLSIFMIHNQSKAWSFIQ